MKSNTENLLIGERLKSFAKNKFGQVSALEKKLGKGRNYLTNYINGRSVPGGELLSQLAELGCDITWLLTGKMSDRYNENMDTIKEINNGVHELKDFVETNVLPIAGYFYKVIMSINAGDPAEIYREENYTGEDVFFPYEKSERCFALKVVGDSMESNNYRSVSEGEFVVVDMDAEILNGDIVVVHLVNGRQMIKQYVAGQDDNIILHSFNPEHPDITVKETDVQAMMRVVGKALLKRF